MLNGLKVISASCIHSFRHWLFTGQQGKGGDHVLFLSTTSTHSQAFRHLKLCIWDDYHVLLIPSLVTTRLPLDEIYHLIELHFEWLMMQYLFLFVYLMVWCEVFVIAIWHGKPVDFNSHRGFVSSTYLYSVLNWVLETQSSKQVFDISRQVHK